QPLVRAVAAVARNGRGRHAIADGGAAAGRGDEPGREAERPKSIRQDGKRLHEVRVVRRLPEQEAIRREADGGLAIGWPRRSVRDADRYRQVVEVARLDGLRGTAATQDLDRRVV